MESQLYPVEVSGIPAECLLGEERVIFHGVNKSGSGMMGNVLFEAFLNAGRSNRYFSTYHACPRDSETLRRIIAASEGGVRLLFLDHYLYGVPEAKAVPCTYVSLLRHPLPRAVSVYFWHRRNAERRAAAEGGGEAFPPLDEWLEQRAPRDDSQFAQFGIGYDPALRKAARKLPDDAVFRTAMEALTKEVRWFGLAEHFEESIFVLAGLLGLPAVPAWKGDQRNAGRTLVHDLPPGTVARIERSFRYDFEFYEHAVGLFKRRVGQMRFGRSLDDYRAACLGEYKDRLL